MSGAFTSVQEFLDAYAGRDFGRKREAIGLVKESARESGVGTLSRISRQQIGPRAPVDFDADGLTLVDALDDAVFEATDSSGDKRYRDVLETFFRELGILSDAPSPDVAKSETDHKPETSGAGPESGPDGADDDSGLDALDALLAGDDFSDVGADPDPRERQPAASETPAAVRDAPDTGAQNAPTSPAAEAVEPGDGHVDFDPSPDVGDTDFETVWGRPTGGQGLGSGELMRLPGLLPPPPARGEGETYAAWLDGAAWHPLAIGMKIDLPAEEPADDLIEMQSELYAMPEAALETYGARRTCDAASSEEDALKLHYAGRDLGRFDITYDAAQDALSRAVMRYFEEHEPKTAEFLGRVGVRTRCTAQLADAVASAIDIEAHFIETGPRDAGQGPISDIRGAISPRARLDIPYALDRAVFLHFGSGVPLATGLRDSLIELRHAQTCRHLGQDLGPDAFDPVFSRDWFQPLEAYETAAEDAPSPL